MNGLDFLSPDRALANGDFEPVLRSSMERRQRDAGATFEERDGWLLPVELPGEAGHLDRVGIADLSHLGKIEVLGAEPDEQRDAAMYQIRPGRSLVLCPFADCSPLRERLAATADRVLDMTAAYAILALAGPESPTVLRRLTDLERLPASGSVAHVHAHVLERDGAFWIVFPQEYGHYLWEAAVDAAEPFGGGPVGVDAVLRERVRA
jgi:glycine cleavage system aminomethyltransferase T